MFTVAGWRRAGQDGNRALALVGRAHWKLHDFDRAIQRFDETLELRMKALGPQHPDTASSMDQVGSAHWVQGQSQTALEHYTRALDVRMKALGEAHSLTAASHSNVGIALMDLGRFEEAAQSFSRCDQILRQVHEAPHPHWFRIAMNQAALSLRQRKLDQAEARYREAVALGGDVLGPKHHDMAQAHSQLGEVLRQKGSLEKARHELELAVAIVEDIHGRDDAAGTLPLARLALTQHQSGRTPEAREQIERAMSQAGASGGPWDLAEIRFAAARVSWEADSARSKELAQQALGFYREHAAGFPHDLTRVEAWAAEHP